MPYRIAPRAASGDGVSVEDTVVRSMDPVELEEHRLKLLRLLALERQAEEERHREAHTQLSIAERIARGWAVGGLDIRDERWGLGGRIILDFALPGEPPDEFRPGAVVTLGRREGGDVAPGVVVRGAGDQLSVAFDQPPGEALTEGGLLLELAPNDLTYRRTKAAVEALQDLGKGEERRRKEVWLGLREPEAPRPAALERSARALGDAPLNEEQREATLAAAASQDLYLVHGPPGTGKSTVLVQVARLAVAAGERVLATAASNAAVDHLLEKCLDAGLNAVRVGHPGRVLPRLQSHTLDLLVESHPSRELADRLRDEAYAMLGYARRQRTRGRSRERFAQARDAKREARAMLKEAREHEARAVEAILQRAEVVCATSAVTAGSLLSRRQFDLVLFDEATQATEPTAWLALHRGGRLVMAGDHHQLPPTVISPAALAQGLGRTLFERLMERHGAAASKMLRRQYRMHGDIMRFSSEQFYHGALVADGSVAAHQLGELLEAAPPELEVPPVLFVDTAGRGFEEEREPNSDSLRNPGEAELMVRWVASLREAGLPAASIGVIAPYAAQVQRLRRRLREEGLLEDLEVATVDAFQGREKEAMGVSLTRSNADGQIGFLGDLRRMNVAMTRARRHLFVVGDSGTLSADPFYVAFVEYTQEIDAYRSVWTWPAAEDL